MKKIIPIALLLALGAAAASAQDGPAPAGLPRIAVYVAGGVPDNEKSALGTRMLASLVRSGRYTAIERSNLFLAEVEKEQLKQRSGAVDDSQIRELGKMFGVTYVCIAAITPAFGTFQVSARIVNVETAAVAFIGESYSMLQSADDLKQVSDEVVKSMFGEQAAPPPEPKPEAKAEPAEQQEAPPAEGAKRAKAGKAEPKPRPAVPAPVPAAQPQQKQEAAEQGQSAQQQAGHEQQIEKERLKEELLEQTKPKKLKVGASFSVGGSGTTIYSIGAVALFFVNNNMQLDLQFNYQFGDYEYWHNSRYNYADFSGVSIPLLLQCSTDYRRKAALFAVGGVGFDWLKNEDGYSVFNSALILGGGVALGRSVHLDIIKCNIGTAYKLYATGVRVVF